jgi:hypothetical protein
MKRKFVTACLLAFAFTASAQDQQGTENIVTDRPDQTEAAQLIPRGTLQIETGGSIENDRVGGVMHQAITYNTTLLRIGLAKHFELRLIQEELNDRYEGKTVAKGAGPLAVGTKIAMLEEKGIFPQIALNAHLKFRTGSKDYKPLHVTPDFRFLFAHTLSKRFSLSYNLGAEWNGRDATTTGIYTLALGIGLTDRLSCFIESYGFFPEHQVADHRADAGLTFLLTHNLQLDVSGGIGLNEVAPDNFISAGISWRIPD